MEVIAAREEDLETKKKLQREKELQSDLQISRGKEMHKAKGSGLTPWPTRLTTPPPCLAKCTRNVSFNYAPSLHSSSNHMVLSVLKGHYIVAQLKMFVQLLVFACIVKREADNSGEDSDTKPHTTHLKKHRGSSKKRGNSGYRCGFASLLVGLMRKRSRTGWCIPKEFRWGCQGCTWFVKAPSPNEVEDGIYLTLEEAFKSLDLTG
ncbi:hypothetical protein JHK85_028441 [Glycine max]|nr:hypothetical protein JHK85_028441 [Glycine max]